MEEVKNETTKPAPKPDNKYCPTRPSKYGGPVVPTGLPKPLSRRDIIRDIIARGGTKGHAIIHARLVRRNLVAAKA